MDYGNTKTPSMYWRLGSTTVAAGFSQGRQPESPMGEIPLGQYSCKKKKVKKKSWDTSWAANIYWFTLFADGDSAEWGVWLAGVGEQHTRAETHYGPLIFIDLLCLQTVTPLNEECGLLEWVNNTQGLRHIVTKLYKEGGSMMSGKELKAVMPPLSSDIE